MFIITNASPTQPLLLLLLSIVHYPTLSVSLSGQWMILDWRTERWWTHVPFSNVQFLSGICLFHISNADVLCLICSFPQPHEDELLNCWINPSPIYIYKNVTLITLHSRWTHLLTLTICSTRHLQWLSSENGKGQTGDLCSIYKSMGARDKYSENDMRAESEALLH